MDTEECTAQVAPLISFNDDEVSLRHKRSEGVVCVAATLLLNDSHSQWACE